MIKLLQKDLSNARQKAYFKRWVMYNTYEEIKSDIENVYKWFFDNVCAKCNKECQHNGRRVLLCSKFQELIEFFVDKK